jgi:hypothetical protein
MHTIPADQSGGLAQLRDDKERSSDYPQSMGSGVRVDDVVTAKGDGRDRDFVEQCQRNPGGSEDRLGDGRRLRLPPSAKQHPTMLGTTPFDRRGYGLFAASLTSSSPGVHSRVISPSSAASVPHTGGVTRAHPPYLVTSAPQSPRDEQRTRQRRYLVTMGIRVVCFVLAIVLATLHLTWAAGIAVAASLVLPWVAVVAANAGPRRKVEDTLLYEPGRRDLSD